MSALEQDDIIPHQHIADAIELALRELVKEHRPSSKKEEDLIVYHWMEKLVIQALLYRDKYSLFKSSADSKKYLEAIKDNISTLQDALRNLPDGDSLLLHIAEKETVWKDTVEKTTNSLASLNDVINHAIADTHKRKENLKRTSHETNQDLIARNSYIQGLITAYKEITSRKIAISRTREGGKPSGPLFRFVKPCIDIIMPDITKEEMPKEDRRILIKEKNIFNALEAEVDKWKKEHKNP